MYAITTPPTAPGDPVLKPWGIGSAAVLVGAPLVGTVLVILGNAMAGVAPHASRLLVQTGALYVTSPLFSWAVLLVMLPVSLICVRNEIGGWGVALCAGMGAGALFGVVLSEGRDVFWTMCIFGSFGATLSIAFWGAIRVFSPLYFGMGRRR